MDGNNRWSVKYNKSLSVSYDIGAKKLFSIAKYIFKNYECEYISAFALSRDNLSRPKKTIKIVVKIFEKYVDELILNHSKYEFNVRIIGNISFLNKNIQKKIDKINLQKYKNKKNLIIFFNYSGTEDIKLAIKKIYKNSQRNYNLKNFLMTKNIPEPDILIRSGGFQRLSDFLLFQVRYTELFFIKKLWPDLNNQDIKKCIGIFSKIKRNYGI